MMPPGGMAGAAGLTTYSYDGDGRLGPDEVEVQPEIDGPALVVRSGGGRAGESFEAIGDRALIGRSPECDVFLDDVTVSRNHALLVRRRDGLYIDDLGSLNGTYVNRRRIESHRLADGDEIQVGKYKLVVPELLAREIAQILQWGGRSVVGASSSIFPAMIIWGLASTRKLSRQLCRRLRIMARALEQLAGIEYGLHVWTIYAARFDIDLKSGRYIGIDPASFRLGKLQRDVQRIHELVDLDRLGKVAEESRLQPALDVMFSTRPRPRSIIGAAIL